MSSPVLGEVFPSPEDVAYIARAVWESFLSCDRDDELRQAAPGPEARATVSSCVHITGAWAGAVVLDCTTALAWVAASRMLVMVPEDLTVGDVADALGELVNMVGGNIKGILPGPSVLSVPTVAVGPDTLWPPGAVPVTEVDFVWRGEPLRVSVLRAPDRFTTTEKSTA